MLQRAAETLRNNQCLVMPTDTLYGLFTRATKTGIALLDEITGNPEVADQPRMTLHLADLDPILEHLVLDTPTARRLVDRLLPGPTRLILEQPNEALDIIASVLTIPRACIDDGSHIALRIPDHPTCRQVLRSAGVACVARRIGAASWAIGDNPGTDLSPIPTGFSEDQSHIKPALILDDGPTHHQHNSTTVHIALDGRISVSEDGVLSERDVLEHLERTILFVCTGNTCRSPMARAIAQHQIAQQDPTAITIHITSAGIAAAPGMPATDQAVDVLRSMGIDLSDHQSRPLTLDMISRAELIYTMTPSHAQAVMTMAPNSVHKVFVLDECESIPDPIGQSTEVYKHTADRLSELIARRLTEIQI